MAGKMPKLIAICGEAKMYEAPFGEVALFWGKNPVALFPSIRAAVRYIYYEFYEEPFEWREEDKKDEDQGPEDWII
jgi:hypothetical protein|tara:strand:- start:516 stop:743 length:228 start_codon:yes stop_codon:yes gene_type:complete